MCRYKPVTRIPDVAKSTSKFLLEPLGKCESDTVEAKAENDTGYRNIELHFFCQINDNLEARRARFHPNQSLANSLH